MTPPLPARLAGAFAGLRAVVAGGTGGVGREVVDQLTALGARVAATSRHGPAADDPAETAGAPIRLALDLADPASIRRLSLWVEARWGALDLLVLAAGASRQIPLARLDLLDDALIDEVVEVNALGPLRLIRDLAPALGRGVDACVVNIGSAAARTGLGSNLAYVGAKAAMEAMFVGLAKRLSPTVRFVTVTPSALDTPFARGRGRDDLERTIAATPMGRLATLTEVADAVILAAKGLPMTTGASVLVDGGRSL
jgi:3-oxoacyl-[acyl-carrier protein] reductase